MNTEPPTRLMPPAVAVSVPPRLLTAALVPVPPNSKLGGNTPPSSGIPCAPGIKVLASNPPTLTLAVPVNVMPAGLSRNTCPLDSSWPLMMLADGPVTRLIAVDLEPA
ncbi:hypothetical protein NMB32_04645 [Stenotrophomonas sp. CD2]|nr:hypothetical protein NMB32_04645 [Stenotrophomonas sp. CD2]